MPQFALATLNHSPLHGLETCLSDTLEATRDAGFDALAPDIFWLRALEKEGTSLDYLSDSLEKHDLSCAEIAGLAIGNEQDTERELNEILRYARVLNTDFVNTRLVLPPDAAVRDRLRRCAEAFREIGVRIALEFSNGTGLKTLTEARSFIEEADAPGVGLTLDTWHFCQSQGGPDWNALDALPLESLANVQLSDGVASEGRTYGEETMNHRRFAGAGDLDLGRCVRTLRSKGFDGSVVVEVLNATLRTWPLSEFAQSAARTTSEWWNGDSPSC